MACPRPQVLSTKPKLVSRRAEQVMYVLVLAALLGSLAYAICNP